MTEERLSPFKDGPWRGATPARDVPFDNHITSMQRRALLAEERAREHADHLYREQKHDGTDAEHLMWLHNRLITVHGEHPLSDYMHRLREIIDRVRFDEEPGCEISDG